MSDSVFLSLYALVGCALYGRTKPYVVFFPVHALLVHWYRTGTLKAIGDFLEELPRDMFRSFMWLAWGCVSVFFRKEDK